LIELITYSLGGLFVAEKYNFVALEVGKVRTILLVSELE